MAKPKSQIAKFRDAARAHEADESEGTFNTALKAVATKRNAPEAKEKLAEHVESGKPKVE
jgi:hypothetical protein